VRRLPLALVACAITFMAEAAGPGSIEPKALGERIAWADHALVVLDVRTPAEYAEGHVPGAINIPHMSIVSRKGELAEDKELVFICEVGSRSALACEFAAAVGFKELYNVEGGTVSWIKSGYSVE
jgi:rhodanese-related sulfurtransferase